MTEDWDQLADDESEWESPVRQERVGRPESVLSVRLPADLAEQIREQADLARVKVGTLLRKLIEEAVVGKPGDVVYLRYSFDASRRQSTSGAVEVIEEQAGCSAATG